MRGPPAGGNTGALCGCEYCPARLPAGGDPRAAARGARLLPGLPRGAVLGGITAAAGPCEGVAGAKARRGGGRWARRRGGGFAVLGVGFGLNFLGKCRQGISSARRKLSEHLCSAETSVLQQAAPSTALNSEAVFLGARRINVVSNNFMQQPGNPSLPEVQQLYFITHRNVHGLQWKAVIRFSRCRENTELFYKVHKLRDSRDAA